MIMKKTGNFLLGLGVGVGLGLLFAPKSGKETRKDIKDATNKMITKVKEIDVKEVKKSIDKKIDQIKKELEDLDKEKALKLAK